MSEQAPPVAEPGDSSGNITLVTGSSATPFQFRENFDDLSASLNDQIELLAGELRARWRRGDRVRIETLGPLFEQLAANEEQLLDLVYHEILLREEFGERPQLDEYAARFPGQVERLQRLFAVHGAIEDHWAEELQNELSSARAPSLSSEEQATGPQVADESTDWDHDREAKRAKWPRRERDQMPVDAPPGYELLEEIGRGGMAVVFRARQRILNRTVALKMLLGGTIASREVLARLQQEARAVAQLQHPGIVQIHEVGEHRGLPYLSLEFVAGGTLHEWLDGQPLPPQDAARLIEQLARTTHFAHERGIVHRDLKPANVLLTQRPAGLRAGLTIRLDDSSPVTPSSDMNPQPKISDFGLARVLGTRSDLTATGQVLGTPSYMAPEQAAGVSDEASAALDIYSLGAILYELLTGRPPFRGATLFDTLEQVRSNEPVPPRRLQPRTPRDLETICLKCLAKAPERRYSTAVELAEDLRRFQQGEPISARPSSGLERGWKWIRRYPAIASLASLAVLLAVAGVAGVVREADRANRNEVQARSQRDAARRQGDLARQERDEAQRQKQRADEQLLRTQEQQRLAEEERQRAVAAQAQAEANYQRALNVVNALVQLGDELRHQPRQQTVSRRIYDETLKFYEGFLSERANDPALQLQVASALIRAGEIRASLNESGKSSELYERGIQHLEQITAGDPAHTGALFLLSGAYWHLANLQRGQGASHESLESYRRSIAAHDALLRLRPGNTLHLIGKANAILNECIVLRQLGRREEALARYQQAEAIERQLVATEPANTHVQGELSQLLHDYSDTLRQAGRKKEADRVLQESLEIRQRLYVMDPKSIGNRLLLSRLHRSLAWLASNEKKYDEASRQWLEADLLAASLVTDYPDVYEYHQSRYLVLADRLYHFLRLKNAEEGLPQWKLVVEHLRGACRTFPQDLYFARRLADWAFPLGNHLYEAGHMQEAEEAFRAGLDAARVPFASAAQLKPNELVLMWNDTAWRLATVPVKSLRQADVAVGLATQAVNGAPENANYRNTLGTALYYAGNYQAARQEILKSNELLGKKVPHNQVILAMILWNQGEEEAARTELAEASEPATDFTQYGPELRYLFAEARALIPQKSTGSSTGQIDNPPPPLPEPAGIAP